MPAAVVGGVIAGAGALGSAAIGASAAKKASKAVSRDNAANNALQEKIYNQNTQNIDPFMQRGNAAGDAMNAILGLPTYQAPQPANSNAPQSMNALSPYMQGGFQFAGDPFRGVQRQPTPQAQIPAGTVQSSMTPQGANDGFRQYIDNSDYAFRQSEGDKGLNQGYAANGLLESGAAMKALERFRQNNQAGYRNEYLGYLGNQQGVGLSGANALAGVGTNYANNVTANNQSATSAQANLGMAGANALGGGLAGAAQGIGTALGSSYGGGVTVPGYGLQGGAPLPMPGYGNSLSAWG